LTAGSAENSVRAQRTTTLRLTDETTTVARGENSLLSDDRYRRAAAAGGVGVWECDLATGEVYVDPVLKQILGYEDHEIGNHIDDCKRLVHPGDVATVYERAKAHIAGHTPTYEAEHRMLHRDGSIRWFIARGRATRDGGGRAISLAGTETDITERKRSEEALRQVEEINKRIVESTTDCLKILDLDGRLIHVNREGSRLLEIDDAALLNRPLVEFFDDAVRRAAEDAIAAACAGGRGRFHARVLASSGVTRWWDVLITPITDCNGAVVQLLAVSRDITERRRDEAFRAARQQMSEMIAAGSALPEVLDCLVRVVEQQCNGMSCSALVLNDDGTTIRHASAPSLPPAYVRAIDGLRIGPRAGSCGTAMFLGKRVIVTDILADPLWEEYRAPAGISGQRACWSMPILSPQQRILGSFAMYFVDARAPSDDELKLIEAAADVARIAIEQHRAQHALRHSEARNRAILRAIPDWVFLTTAEGVYVDYHAKDASQLYAHPSSFIGRSIKDVIPSPVSERLLEACARVRSSEEPEEVEYALVIDGEERFYEARLVGCDGDKILSIVRDVTEQKSARMEAAAQRLELAHLSRVAVLGELTGALAHELSQPLTAVLSNAQAAKEFLNREPLDVPELRAVVDDILSDNRRAGAVIERLRALLRKQSFVLRPVNLNDVVLEVVDFAHSEIIARRVTVTSTLASGASCVMGDRVQLQQVVLNLLLNACDAMSATPPSQRRLALTTTADDDFVQLVVADRGVGIPKDRLNRVFEPFVTFRDQGLGLGLAISRSIVSAHNGSIQAENNVDGGATFRCSFPLAAPRAIERAT
jgi:PAS domain S-box-containing protein